VPFPLLAHQAPVLPLKLWRPRAFSTVALCVGSLAPDLEFLLSPEKPGIGHSLVGQLVFCLPITVLLTWLIARYVGPALASRLPRARRWRFEDLGSLVGPFSSRRAFGVVATSSLVGSLSHLLLDSFTHRDSWVSIWLPVVSRGVHVFGRRMAVTRLLQLVLSLLGAALALYMIDRLLARSPTDASDPAASRSPSPKRARGGWLLVASSVALAIAAVAASRPIVAHSTWYFELGPQYVWGYVLFRACCAGFLGLMLAAIALEWRRAAPFPP